MAGKIRPEQLGTAAAITSLLNAADAAAGRTALGLGSLATKSTVGYADLSATIGGRNLLANGGAERGTVGWVGAGLSSLAVSSTQKYEGSQSLKLTASTAGGVTYAAASAGVKPATTYTVSAWLYVESITAAAEYNRAMALYDGTVFVSDATLTTAHTTGAWVRKVLRITTSASATTLFVRLYCPQGAVYWDCIQFDEGDVPTAWRPHPSEVTDPVLINTPQLINLKAAADDAAAATAGVPVGGMYQAAGVLRVRLS